MVNNCVMACRSNYHGESTVPAFSFSNKHENLKSKRIRFSKIGNQALPYLLFTSATLKRCYFKKWQKRKENSIDKLVKICSEYLPK